MLKVRNLTKVYDDGTVALRNVSFHVEEGEFLAIIGLSGSGKSTLLRCINRLIDATEGSVTWDGVELTDLKGDELRKVRRQIGMIFQQFNLVPRLDVITNVLMGRVNSNSTPKTLLKMFSPAERAFAIRALDRLDVSAQALQRADTLSGGQQQRVAIARALVQEPGLLLADEPISSLDPRNASIVMDALLKINREDGITVLCNLHTLDTAKAYCERIIGMKQGAFVFDGPPSDLKLDMLRDIYGVGEDDDDEEFSTAITSTSIEVVSDDGAEQKSDGEAASG